MTKRVPLLRRLEEKMLKNKNRQLATRCNKIPNNCHSFGTLVGYVKRTHKLKSPPMLQDKGLERRDAQAS